MTITVLRLGHRPQRDKRLSTHLILCARALGAEKAYYTGVKDPKFEEGISSVVENWGGDFKIEYSGSQMRLLRNWEGKIVHLTMYGARAEEVVKQVKCIEENLLIVVGGAKVPREVYEKADWNVSLTTQPHSEVSALALFIYLLEGESSLRHEFLGGRIKITPTLNGKDVEVLRDTQSAKTKSNDNTV